MKGTLYAGIGLFIALSACAVQATLIPTVTVTVDENGNGSIGSQALTGSLIADPGNPDHKVLAYVLPAPVTPGDVVLNEPGQSEGGSDLIRFVNVTGGDDEEDVRTNTDSSDSGDDEGSTQKSLLLFYSEAEKGETSDLADVGLPTNRQTDLKTFDETGLFEKSYSEAGPNGLVYTPAAGDPGSLAAVVIEPDSLPAGVVNLGLNYVFISDAAPSTTPGTPLPASDWAGLALLVGLWAWRVIRKRITT